MWDIWNEQKDYLCSKYFLSLFHSYRRMIPWLNRLRTSIESMYVWDSTAKTPTDSEQSLNLAQACTLLFITKKETLQMCWVIRELIDAIMVHSYMIVLQAVILALMLFSHFFLWKFWKTLFIVHFSISVIKTCLLLVLP